MKLIDVIEDLIRFRTETGNSAEIGKCLEYIERSLKDAGAQVEVLHYPGVSPVLFAANRMTNHFDVLIIGHIDVVPAAEEMFSPRREGNRLYGRGTLDMKSFAAVAMNSLSKAIRAELPLSFGVILSTDEEKGSKSTEAFLNAHPDLRARIVLDNDVGGDIGKIVLRCKNPVFVKLTACGEAAHGSTPWDGLDANERLMQTWQNIRRFYPYYSKDNPKPADTWINTVHFAKICGGAVANVISSSSEALLDFRLTETVSTDDLCAVLDQCLARGVNYEIVSAATPVMMSSENPDILQYREIAQHVLGRPVEFEYIGGATDSRVFALRGSTVIMHSGSGEGMHAEGEFVELDSVEQLADIQFKFLEQLAAQGIKNGKNQ